MRVRVASISASSAASFFSTPGAGIATSACCRPSLRLLLAQLGLLFSQNGLLATQFFLRPEQILGPPHQSRIGDYVRLPFAGEPDVVAMNLGLIASLRAPHRRLIRS